MTIYNTLDPNLLERTIKSVESLDGSHDREFWPIEDDSPDRLRSPQSVKNLNEFYDLVNQAVQFHLGS